MQLSTSNLKDLNKYKDKKNIYLIRIITYCFICSIIQISQYLAFKTNQNLFIFVNSQIISPYYLSKYIYSQNSQYSLITTLASASSDYTIKFQTPFSNDSPIPNIIFGISKHFMSTRFIIQGFQLTFTSKTRNNFILHNNMETSTGLTQLKINYFAFVNPSNLIISYPLVFHQFTYLKTFQSTDNVMKLNGARKTTQIKNIPNDQLSNKIQLKNISINSGSTSIKLSYLLHGFHFTSQGGTINGFNISINLIFNNASALTIQYGTSYQCYLQKIGLQIIFIIEDKNVPSLLYMNIYNDKLNSGLNFNVLQSISNYTNSLISSFSYMFGTQNFNNDDSNIQGQYELVYNSIKPHEYQVYFYNKTFKGYNFGVLIIGLKQCGSSHWTNQSYIQCISYCNIKYENMNLLYGGPNKNNVCIVCQQDIQYYDENTLTCELLQISQQSQTGVIVGVVITVVLIAIGMTIGIVVYRIYKSSKNNKNRLDRTHPSADKIIQQADIRID